MLATTRRLVALTPAGECDLDEAMHEAGADDVALMVGSEGPGLILIGLIAWAFLSLVWSPFPAGAAEKARQARALESLMAW